MAVSSEDSHRGGRVLKVPQVGVCAGLGWQGYSQVKYILFIKTSLLIKKLKFNS